MKRLFSRPVLGPMVAGAVARLLAATWGSGFHARDDYFHVLAPAVRWLQDPHAPWDTGPGALIRSHLLPRIVHGILAAEQALGVEQPELLLAGVQLALGLWSLTVIPALYLAGKQLGDETTGCLAAWLGALHFAMPYAGTRLLLGGVAMPAVAWAIALGLNVQRRRELIGAGACWGLAVWLRYPALVAAAAFVLTIAWQRGRSVGWRRGLEVLAWSGLGFTAVMLAQGLFDLVTTGRWFGPLLANIASNLCSAGEGGWACGHVRQLGLAPHTQLTRSSALSYLGFWLLLTAPPATLIVVPALVRVGLRVPPLSWPFLVFVLVHSLVPHKEERFMLPVMPLFLLALALVPREVEGVLTTGRTWWLRRRRAWLWCKRWWLLLHGLALLLTVTNHTQANLHTAMVALREDPQARAVISVGPELQPFFLSRPEMPAVRRSTPDATWFHTMEGDLRAIGIPLNRVLAFAPDRDVVTQLLVGLGYDCNEPEVLNGWWLDRLLFRLNPKHNRRRAPILLWRCELPSMAVAPPALRNRGSSPHNVLLAHTSPPAMAGFFSTAPANVLFNSPVARWRSHHG